MSGSVLGLALTCVSDFCVDVQRNLKCFCTVLVDSIRWQNQMVCYGGDGVWVHVRECPDLERA